MKVTAESNKLKHENSWQVCKSFHRTRAFKAPFRQTPAGNSKCDRKQGEASRFHTTLCKDKDDSEARSEQPQNTLLERQASTESQHNAIKLRTHPQHPPPLQRFCSFSPFPIVKHNDKLLHANGRLELFEQNRRDQFHNSIKKLKNILSRLTTAGSYSLTLTLPSSSMNFYFWGHILQFLFHLPLIMDIFTEHRA